MIEVVFVTPWAQWLVWVLAVMLIASQAFLVYAKARNAYWKSKLTEDDVKLVARVRATLKDMEDEQ